MSHYIKLSLQQNLALGQIVKLQDNTFLLLILLHRKDEVRGRAKEKRHEKLHENSKTQGFDLKSVQCFG